MDILSTQLTTFYRINWFRYTAQSKDFHENCISMQRISMLISETRIGASSFDCSQFLIQTKYYSPSNISAPREWQHLNDINSLRLYRSRLKQ